MKKLTFIIIMLMMIILSGCTTPHIDKELVIIKENITIAIDEELDVTLPEVLLSSEAESLFWSNDDNNILALYDGKIFGIATGSTIVKVSNDEYVFELTVTVYDSKKYQNDLRLITIYVREQMGLIDNEFFSIVTKMDGYEFEISYISQDPILLDLNGHFVKGLIDRYVYLDATIIYMGIESTFTVPVKITMIKAEEQKNIIEGYINEEIKDIVKSESGQLPTYFAVYNLAITWQANLPGVIGFDNKLNRAYNSEDVTLYAHYPLGGEKEVMQVKYVSSGVDQNEKAEYINRVLGQLVPEESTKWINTIYGNSEEVIQDFIYPDANTQLRPGNGKNGVKMVGGPQYVVIHDTGMANPGDDAEGLNRFIHNNANSEAGRVASWHFSIDDKQTYQHVPTDEVAWHAGDGSVKFGSTYFNTTYNVWSIGGGNLNGIGIETCINPENDYDLTLKRTAKLTASLLFEYGLTLDRVKTHNDFSGKNCPAVIRSQKGKWEDFLRDVEIEYFLLTVADEVHVEWEISNTEVVKPNGLVVKPINDTTVNLKLKLSLNGVLQEFNYSTLVKGIEVSEKLTKTYYNLLISHIPNKATENIVLPKTNEMYSAVISWTSDHENILSNTGVYNKPTKETIVVLTAVITINNESLTKTFSIKVS